MGQTKPNLLQLYERLAVKSRLEGNPKEGRWDVKHSDSNVIMQVRQVRTSIF